MYFSGDLWHYLRDYDFITMEYSNLILLVFFEWPSVRPLSALWWMAGSLWRWAKGRSLWERRVDYRPEQALMRPGGSGWPQQARAQQGSRCVASTPSSLCPGQPGSCNTAPLFWVINHTADLESATLMTGLPSSAVSIFPLLQPGASRSTLNTSSDQVSAQWETHWHCYCPVTWIWQSTTDWSM